MMRCRTHSVDWWAGGGGMRGEATAEWWAEWADRGGHWAITLLWAAPYIPQIRNPPSSHHATHAGLLAPPATHLIQQQQVRVTQQRRCQCDPAALATAQAAQAGGRVG